MTDARSVAGASWRRGSEPCGSPGSGGVIGLSLAVSKERMEVKNRGCDTRPGSPVAGGQPAVDAPAVRLSPAAGGRWPTR
eukprot:scaffold4194_cov131-Isochrysis_galbana.AAC.4